jgi:hypothetical protein
VGAGHEFGRTVPSDATRWGTMRYEILTRKFAFPFGKTTQRPSSSLSLQLSRALSTFLTFPHS